MHLQLFVEILNEYLIFFERKCPTITYDFTFVGIIAERQFVRKIGRGICECRSPSVLRCFRWKYLDGLVELINEHMSTQVERLALSACISLYIYIIIDSVSHMCCHLYGRCRRRQISPQRNSTATHWTTSARSKHLTSDTSQSGCNVVRSRQEQIGCACISKTDFHVFVMRSTQGQVRYKVGSKSNA